MGIKTLIWLSILVVGIYCEISDEDAPVHYCFVNPPPKTRLSPNLLQNITTCTHLVYGSIPIDRDTGYPQYSVSDVESGYDIDNIRTFMRLRKYHPNAKLLMGVVRTKPFEDAATSVKVANGLRSHVKSKRFDGLFVTFNGIHLEYRASTSFLETISKDKKMSLTFGVTGRRVFAFDALRRLQEINDLVEYIYLDMGELPSNEELARVTHINPLFYNGSIPFEETIQGTVEELSKEGILPSRIVVGLTAGGWKFEIKETQDPLKISHGQYAENNGKRVSYQDACRARGAVIYDWQTMNEITVYRQTWMSVNLPTIKAMGEKMKWILGQKFAGIGISHALFDDPRGDCGTDPLPAHRLVMELIRNTIPANPAKCTRLCYLDPEEVEETFPIDNLKSDYCSHIVVPYFALDLSDKMIEEDKAEDLVKKIDDWRSKIVEVAPRLILSVGSKQASTIWQFLLGNDFHRKELAEGLVKAINSTNADGLEISWTSQPMVSDFDKKNLKSFINDIVAADTAKMVEIVVATSQQSAYSDFYDYEHLNKTASLIVLHSHRLHSDSLPFTGHPSPLRATSSMTNQKMSWESLLSHWVEKRVLPSKLVLSLSASTLSMQSLADVRSSAATPFGQSAFVSMLRSKKGDIHSQQEICESLKSGTGVTHWVDGAEVPYLRRYDQMVAYENTRSAHIKAVWASMEGVGGLALHNMHQDDPSAVCDNRTAFPILNALSRAQVCQTCLKQHDFKKCEQHDFVVSCNFELKRSTPVFKTDIVPYERCTEVVVEQATLTLGGNVNFNDVQQEQVVKNLTSLRSKMVKCGMVLSLSCGDSEKYLNSILGDNMTFAIGNVMNIMEKYKFSGVQLDCEKVIRRGNHIYFNTFVKKLAQKFESGKASNGCNRTLSARFSHYTQKPSTYYSVSLLNRLSHIALRMTDKHSVDLPFFFNHTKPEFPSTEKFVNIWKNVGLKPDKLVLELSPFGWQTGKKVGEKKKMTQGVNCVTAGNRAVYEHDYETLTGMTKHENGTINMPMIEDFRYKIGYIQREQLGGIALNVNRDTERHETHVNQCEMSSSFSATSPSTSSAYQLEEHISAPRATPELPPSDPKRRKWQSHPGRNRFGCGGRLVCSRSHGAFVVTVILMIATLTVYFVFDAPFLWGYSPAIPIVAAVLSLIVITNFFATSFTDPGILPRVDNIEIIEMDRQQANGNGINDVAHLRPRFQDVVVNGEHVKMKYCTTCRLYRPPRCSHCAICDNCVLMFDHHCPWVGNCIGLRNYTYFYRFVFCLSILVIYLFASAVTHISLLAQEMPFGDVMRKTPGSAVVIVICFFTTWSIIGLACFHTYLLCADLTTNEDLKGLYRRKHRPTPPSSTPSTSAATNSSVGHSTKNPFYAGCFKSFFGRLFKSRFPSLLDARGYLDPHPTIEIRVPKKSEKSIENH